MPGPVAYWTWTTAILAVAIGLTVAVVMTWRRAERRRLANPRLLHGVATGPEVRAAAGLREVRRRARHAPPPPRLKLFHAPLSEPQTESKKFDSQFD